jgi:rhodanese-related sulfurtransferase
MRLREEPAGYARDFIGVLCLALASLAAGLIINRFRPSPLPFPYQSPERRFDTELTTLIVSPPFKIAPATTVGLDQFRSALFGKSTLIFDARPSSFYELGHVPGALNLARDNFAHAYRELDSVLNDAQDKPIIVYCGGGDCHDSRLVANALATLGYGDVSAFTGGWQEWSAENLPIATGSNP